MVQDVKIFMAVFMPKVLFFTWDNLKECIHPYTFHEVHAICGGFSSHPEIICVQFGDHLQSYAGLYRSADLRSLRRDLKK